MSLITLPNSEINKNQEYTLYANKSEIAAHPLIVDSYWKDAANWKLINVIFKSIHSEQQKPVIFDATQAVPSGIFKISDKAISVFDMEKIILEDFDGDRFILNYSELSVEERESMQLKYIQKIAPAAKIIAVQNDSLFTVDDSSFFEQNFSVKLWDNQQGVFVGQSRKIVGVDVNTISLNLGFGVTPDNTGRYYLRFDKITSCYSAQQTNYHFTREV